MQCALHPCAHVHYNKILGFEGRWANEFQRQPVDRFMGTYLRENRSGRTSHDSFPGVIIHTEQTNEAAAQPMACIWVGVAIIIFVLKSSLPVVPMPSWGSYFFPVS